MLTRHQVVLGVHGEDPRTQTLVVGGGLAGLAMLSDSFKVKLRQLVPLHDAVSIAAVGKSRERKFLLSTQNLDEVREKLNGFFQFEALQLKDSFREGLQH